jgi:hypothetical protein
MARDVFTIQASRNGNERRQEVRMNRTFAALLMTGTLLGALGAAGMVRADDDDDNHGRAEYLDRHIDRDRAKINDERRDLGEDWRKLKEEEREGDWNDAARIRRDMDRDQRQLDRDQRDVWRDRHQRHELEEDED